MSADLRNRLSLLGVVLLLAIAYLLMQRMEATFTANEGRLQIIEDPGRDAVILRWSDAVAAPMGRRFEEAYGAYADRVSLFVIELNSPGGALSEGRRVIELLERMKETHRVETRVRAGQACLSMCVPIFLQGETRVAARSSRFMFHEPASYDSFTGERGGEPAFERRLVADRFFERYFVNSPMTPEWRAWLQREWEGRDVWKTGRELVREDSGVVTELG